MGVISGCLDEVTCRHTTNLHGDKYSSKELRAVVNTFISTNVRDSSAMQIGSLEAGEGRQEEEKEENFDGELHTLKGKGKGKCYNCGGKGHIAADCPSPAQAKGGGKSAAGKGGKSWQKGSEYGKGGGKGGKGPVGGCWICGGKHYASACTKGGGKGQGQACLDGRRF